MDESMNLLVLSVMGRAGWKYEASLLLFIHAVFREVKILVNSDANFIRGISDASLIEI